MWKSSSPPVSPAKGRRKRDVLEQSPKTSSTHIFAITCSMNLQKPSVLLERGDQGECNEEGISHK